MEKVVQIACDTGHKAKLDDLHHFQGELKTLTKENYEKLRDEIINTGFAFAPHVWRDFTDGGEFKLLDGHQRCRVLKQMRDQEGWTIPPIPIVEVQAKDFQEAKRRILQGTSQYGVMETQGLYEFLHEANLTHEVLESFRFPDVEVKDFKEEYSPAEEVSSKNKCPSCGHEF